MLDRIIAMLQREIDSIEHSLLAGACPDYTVYREQVGALGAYRDAIQLAKKAFSEEDDDE
jgi:hypothetical protein